MGGEGILGSEGMQQTPFSLMGKGRVMVQAKDVQRPGGRLARAFRSRGAKQPRR